MPIECTTTGCQVRLPYSHFISTTYQDFTRVISNDCSRNMVVFTDDPGLVDQDDPASGAYLEDTESLNYKFLFSSDDVADHWAECSRTYQELAWFFNAPRQRGFRPSSVVVAYRAPGDSYAEAYSKLTKCFCCFRWVTHVSHDVNDAPLHDLPEQLEFATLLRADRKIPMFPTADPVLATSFSETGSIPGQAGSTEVGAGWFYMWNDTGCEYICSDADGNEVRKPWYQPDHIMGAAIGASYGFTDATYNWTLFMKPPGGWPGARCSTFGQSEVINITGTHPDTGFLLDAARSVNLYVCSKARTKGFIEGMTDNGYFIDDIAKRFAIEEDIMHEVLTFQHSQTDAIAFTDEGDLAALDARVISRVRAYINKGIMPDRLPANIADNIENFPDYQWSSRFDNIIAGGDGFGWVVARQTLDQMSEAEQSQRFGPIYFVCFISNRPLHRARINICSTIKPSQIA